MEGPLASQRTDGLPHYVLRPAPDRRRREGGRGFVEVLLGAEEPAAEQRAADSAAGEQPALELGFGQPTAEEVGLRIDLVG